MSSSLENKRIVIIGGTSGFGLEVARQSLDAGADVVVTGRDRARLEAVAMQLQAIRPSTIGYVLDAADPAGLDARLREIGPFDHLVSMAGGFMGGGFLDAELDVIHKAVEDKLYQNLNIARAARPYLREGGSMVFTAGSGGKPHTASGAIVGNESIRTLVRGLAVEMAPHGRVNAVSPTWTRTPLWRSMTADQVEQTQTYFNSLIPLGRTANIDEVAMTYVFLMANTFITGQTIAVDGGVDLV